MVAVNSDMTLTGALSATLVAMTAIVTKNNTAQAAHIRDRDAEIALLNTSLLKAVRELGECSGAAARLKDESERAERLSGELGEARKLVEKVREQLRACELERDSLRDQIENLRFNYEAELSQLRARIETLKLRSKTE